MGFPHEDRLNIARVFSMNMELSIKLGERLRAGRMSLCVAESCTGGLLGSLITAVPGSSDYFLGGMICYSDRIKRDLLGVPGEILEKYGAVSPRTAASMAEHACRVFGAECGIGLTGIAGPGGGGEEKPVGLVYIAVQCGTRLKTIENRFSGNRDQIREESCDKALETLIEMLL